MLKHIISGEAAPSPLHLPSVRRDLGLLRTRQWRNRRDDEQVWREEYGRAGDGPQGERAGYYELLSSRTEVPISWIAY